MLNSDNVIAFGDPKLDPHEYDRHDQEAVEMAFEEEMELRREVRRERQMIDDDGTDRPDDTWNLIAQEVDERHKELVNGFLSEENLVDVVRYFYKQLKDSSLVEAIEQVAVTHGLDEKTVRKNYFHGGGNES